MKHEAAKTKTKKMANVYVDGRRGKVELIPRWNVSEGRGRSGV